jgi:WD40 repeat protein
MAMRSPTTRPIVVSASDDATVRVWDLDARGLLYQPLEAHKGKVDAVAVGELRGRPIAVSGGNDRTVRVWDLAASGPLGEPLVHNRFVNAVAVGELHDRSLAASGDAEETVRPAMATTLPAPGREAQTTLGSRGVDQGGSARSPGEIG